MFDAVFDVQRPISPTRRETYSERVSGRPASQTKAAVVFLEPDMFFGNGAL